MAEIIWRSELTGQALNTPTQVVWVSQKRRSLRIPGLSIDKNPKEAQADLVTLKS